LRTGFGISEHNHLVLHEFDLVELCDEYGTPLFVFDQDCMVGNLERFRSAFEHNGSRPIVCYSVKTNNKTEICETMRREDVYAEVASELVWFQEFAEWCSHLALVRS